MLEHVYITGHQGILASKIQIFSFINFSGSSCTKDGIWYVHQPCICTRQRCHLDPAKQKKKMRENDCQPQNRVLTLGPQRSCLVTQQISVRQQVHLTQSQPHFFNNITWQLGQFRASPPLIKPQKIKDSYCYIKEVLSMVLNQGSVNFPNLLKLGKFFCCSQKSVVYSVCRKSLESFKKSRSLTSIHSFVLSEFSS